jgi:hypothetical protein
MRAQQQQQQQQQQQKQQQAVNRQHSANSVVAIVTSGSECDRHARHGGLLLAAAILHFDIPECIKGHTKGCMTVNGFLRP